MQREIRRGIQILFTNFFIETIWIANDTHTEDIFSFPS